MGGETTLGRIVFPMLAGRPAGPWLKIGDIATSSTYIINFRDVVNFEIRPGDLVTFNMDNGDSYETNHTMDEIKQKLNRRWDE